MKSFAAVLVLATSLLSCASLYAQDDDATTKSQTDQTKKLEKGDDGKKAEKDADQKDKDEKESITLEKLFPKDSLFGPEASGMSFSKDGKFAAFLYRPYNERRHGNDLWIYDFESAKLARITDVVVMSQFQRSARSVKEDRLAKHKKEEGEKSKRSERNSKQSNRDKDDSKAKDEKNSEATQNDSKKKEEEQEKERQIVLNVDEKDADDESAPRYSGISGFTWHPESNSLLITSEGDIYQVDNVENPTLNRLTRTLASESQVEFLPDGAGFTYNLNGIIHRVRFGQSLIEQLNPRLPDNLYTEQYELSPDGSKLVVVGRGRGGEPQGQRTVDIIRYRDRFAKADSVARTVSDDAKQSQDIHVFLYDFEKGVTEESELIEVFHTKIDDPRDVISTPHWSPDSKQVTFAFFDQNSDEVQILLAKLPNAQELEKLQKEAAKSTKSNVESSDKSEGLRVDGRRRGGERLGPGGPSRRTEATPLKHNARIVYRFMHYGGPNTPGMVSPDWAWDSHRIVFLSEQSGFRHVHILDPLYESVRQLTSGNFEVYPKRFSKDHRSLLVTATKESHAREMVYTLDLESGKLSLVSPKPGTYSSAAISSDGKRVLANYVTYGSLTELYAQSEKGKFKRLTDSHPAETKKLTTWKPEFFDYANRHGHRIHGMMFKPKNWDKNKKYPLLIYVYGGPLGTRKSVTDGSYSPDAYFFQGYMAEKHDYVTVVIDPRGQSGYGGLFEKSNYEQVGKPQVEDLVDGVKYLKEEFQIDEQRVGIFGWSFGGFQTQMCMYTEPDVFKVGMAGAGPTEWENYNSWYTTGTVGPSQTGKPDQQKYSLRPLAKNLKGKLLLIHGVEDTNVLFQDTIAIYRELLQAGKEANVELFIDPTGGHGLDGDVKRINRMRKYEEFLLRTLGAGATVETAKTDSETKGEKSHNKDEKPNWDPAKYEEILLKIFGNSKASKGS